MQDASKPARKEGHGSRVDRLAEMNGRVVRMDRFESQIRFEIAHSNWEIACFCQALRVAGKSD
jgi:hypothetical protein